MNRKEFAKYLDIKDNYLRSLISKGKIIEVDGEIDSNNPVNWAFILKQKNKVVGEKMQLSPPPQTTAPPKTRSTTKNVSSPEITTTIDYEKKSIEIVKIKADIKLKELEYAKKKKKVIPLRLFASNINTFLVGTVGKTKNQLDTFIEDLAFKHDFDNDQALKYKRYISETIDSVIKNSVSSAILEMEKEAEEYSLMTSW